MHNLPKSDSRTRILLPLPRTRSESVTRGIFMALLNFLMERLDHRKGRRNGLLSAPFSRSQRWGLTRHAGICIPSRGDEAARSHVSAALRFERQDRDDRCTATGRSGLVKNKMQSQAFSSLTVKQNTGAASSFNDGRRTKHLHSNVWPAGTAKGGCKKAKEMFGC